jgi:cyanophycin synthetase
METDESWCCDAAAWALDIPFNVIEAGAETFVSDASIPVGV